MNATLILLVGSNPVPNYLSACALRPSRIALVYTDETIRARDRLKETLGRELGDAVTFVEDPDPFVEDATSATVVTRVIKNLLSSLGAKGGVEKVLLNYTGGTKVMATHARLAYDTSGDKAAHASYLDEGGKKTAPRLRFDDGTSKLLSEYGGVSLALDTMLALHGVRRRPRTTRDPAPTTGDAEAILGKVLADVSLAEALYKQRKRLEGASNPKKLVGEPFRAASYDLALSLPEFPTQVQLERLRERGFKSDEIKSWFEQWYKFIGGGWLEEWVGVQIRQIPLNPGAEITVGIDAFRGQREVQLEVDVAVLRGNRSYFISCTTDTSKDLCKLKLFEVTVRARNLGGDLARAALVCLASENTVKKLRDDAEEVWGASNITQVYGLDDVRSWSQGNRYALQTWFES